MSDQWVFTEPESISKVRANGYFGYNNDSSDGLNELSRGPMSRTIKNQKPLTSITIAVKGQEDIVVSPTDGIKDELKEVKEVNVTPDREQYTYVDAKFFFIIKSYSEDDVQKCIKYNVLASTQNGNKKLDAAYHEAQQKSETCLVFLFLSVNTSEKFVGVAEIVGAVDLN
ncbi:putative YTH domain-containing protein [Helianthus annuus]|nr:putative YTH domain-containing protein [Helianthus annuus]